MDDASELSSSARVQAAMAESKAMRERKRREIAAIRAESDRLVQEVYGDPAVASALLRAEALRYTVLASVDVRRRAEHPEMPLWKFLSKGQAFIEIEQSRTDSARLVLPELVRAWYRRGFSGGKLRAAMAEDIESACNSLELSQIQKRVLEIELTALLMTEEFRATTSLPAVRPDQEDSSPLDGLGRTRIKDPIAAERRAAFEHYAAECRAEGVILTDKKMAAAASPKWHNRDRVKWWKANDKRSTPTADRLIRDVLRRKPHLPSR